MKKIFILDKNYDYSNYVNVIKNCSDCTKILISANYKNAFDCDALLLTGGGDPIPQLYREKNYFCSDMDFTRDREELILIKHFSKLNKPILGICRGMQILNIAFGGSLNQNLKNLNIHSRCEKKEDKIHEVVITKNSFLSNFCNKKALVNSAHHQSIKNISKDFLVASISQDNVIEAMQHKTKKIYAVQWHPERLYNISENKYANGKLLFTYFISLL